MFFKQNQAIARIPEWIFVDKKKQQNIANETNKVCTDNVVLDWFFSKLTIKSRDPDKQSFMNPYLTTYLSQRS